MAEEISAQKEGMKHLNISNVRRSPQILLIQGIAISSLIAMYLTWVQTYLMPTPFLGHVSIMEILESKINSAVIDPSGEAVGLSLTGSIIGMGQNGRGQYVGPIIIATLLGVGLALLSFQKPKTRRRARLAIAGLILVLLIGRMIPYMLGQLWTLLAFLLKSAFSGFGNDWEWRWASTSGFIAPTVEQQMTLVWPIILFIQIAIILAYTAPVWIGSRGVVGLRRRGIRTAVVLMLLVIIVHAVVTWDVIVAIIQKNAEGSCIVYIPPECTGGIHPLSNQIGGGTEIFGLVTEEQFRLVLIAALMLVFIETGNASIRYMDYAFKLPEACKRDPEYVRQFESLLNGHLVHTAAFFGIAAFAAMISMQFHKLLLQIVEKTLELPGLESAQWTFQIRESLELELTYGLVISALLFLAFASLLRLILPWQTLFGILERLNPLRRS